MVSTVSDIPDSTLVESLVIAVHSFTDSRERRQRRMRSINNKLKRIAPIDIPLP
jgi:hypothetical protein